MPTLLVFRDPKKIPGATIKPIVAQIPSIVARNLSCDHPDGHLEPEDVSVRVFDNGEYDLNVPDLGLVLFANEYPERLIDFEERKERIREALVIAVADHPTKIECSVWSLLAQGAYALFEHVPKK